MTVNLLQRGSGGFTLVEMIVVVFLLALAMLGILAVFDASARINKSETQVADAQGSVRFGLDRMTQVIRMAGAGGLHMRQAVLRQGCGLAGISPSNVSYDNVAAGTTVADPAGLHQVRPGTDMIEVRGVIRSPLYSLFGTTCSGTPEGCRGSGNSLAIPEQTGNEIIGVHYNNNNPNRLQFPETLSYTGTASLTSPMLFLVASNEDQSSGCSVPPAFPLYPLPVYNVARLTAPATLPLSSQLSVTGLDFTNAIATQFNGPDPAVPQTASNLTNLSRGGPLDDILFFIDNGVGGANADHPSLAQATRRGAQFDIVAIADDVEDMQVAYGVDTSNPPNGLNPNVSATAGADEWWPNAYQGLPPPGETAAMIPPFVPALPLGNTCPRLHGIMISLLSKSRDPDPTYKAPAAAGYRLMNVDMRSVIPIVPVTMAGVVDNSEPLHFRRRIQTVRITLRNYGFQEP